jgi:hypothetical protein
LCERSNPSIAHVRYLRDKGLVLWYRVEPGQPPSQATPLDELARTVPVWCPVCGPMTIDVDALAKVVKTALQTHKRVKFTVV